MTANSEVKMYKSKRNNIRIDYYVLTLFIRRNLITIHNNLTLGQL